MMVVIDSPDIDVVCAHSMIAKKAQVLGINSKVGELSANIPHTCVCTQITGTYISLLKNLVRQLCC
jgi:hypothetical protein